MRKLLFVLVPLVGLGLLVWWFMRRGSREVRSPIVFAPNSVVPGYASNDGASPSPDASWCSPFASSTFLHSIAVDSESHAVCRTPPGNGTFRVRMVGGQLKRSKIRATIK